MFTPSACYDKSNKNNSYNSLPCEAWKKFHLFVFYNCSSPPPFQLVIASMARRKTPAKTTLHLTQYSTQYQTLNKRNLDSKKQSLQF